MVIIRLSRYGRKKKPIYNIIVSDRRYFRNSKFIEKIGFYNPFNDLSFINFNILNKWIKFGALISKRVLYIIKKYKKNNSLK